MSENKTTNAQAQDTAARVMEWGADVAEALRVWAVTTTNSERRERCEMLAGQWATLRPELERLLARPTVPTVDSNTARRGEKDLLNEAQGDYHSLKQEMEDAKLRRAIAEESTEKLARENFYLKQLAFAGRPLCNRLKLLLQAHSSMDPAEFHRAAEFALTGAEDDADRFFKQYVSCAGMGITWEDTLNG